MQINFGVKNIIKPLSEKRGMQIEIDLSGPQGNAFYLLGTAKSLAKQLGLDADLILKEMRGGNYENLLEVFEKYFGDYVVLYR